MPRKRKSDQAPSTDSNTNVTDQPAAEASTATAEPAAPEAPAEPSGGERSFAERVGQRQYPAAPDPFGIAADYVAGVRLFESKQDRQMAIKFGDGSPESKPSQDVIAKMKDAGYRWDAADRVWTHPVRSDTALSTRIAAEQLYQEVRQMIREEKGIGQESGVPF